MFDPKAAKTQDAPESPEVGDEALDPVESYRMPLLEHLRELRKRLITTIVTTLVSCVICFAFVQPIWDFLVAPMNDALTTTGRGTLAITAPLEGFMTYLKVAGVAGVGLASPVIFYQSWKFVAPGLYPKEQKAILPLVFWSTLLFGLGASFGYFVIFRYAFPYFLEITSEDVQAVLSINSYLSLATRLLLAFGFCFQLPVVVYFLARIGLVNHRDLIKGFRVAMVLIFVVAAIMTPPDVVSQVLMAGPLTLLYGISIGVARIVSTKPVNPAK